jgi:hypothetical protein
MCGCTQGAIACRPFRPMVTVRSRTRPECRWPCQGPDTSGATRGFPRRRCGVDLDARLSGNDVSAAVGGWYPEPLRSAVWPVCGREFFGPSREHAIEGQRVAALDGGPTTTRVTTGGIPTPHPVQFMKKPNCKCTKEMAPATRQRYWRRPRVRGDRRIARANPGARPDDEHRNAHRPTVGGHGVDRRLEPSSRNQPNAFWARGEASPSRTRGAPAARCIRRLALSSASSTDFGPRAQQGVGVLHVLCAAARVRLEDRQVA